MFIPLYFALRKSFYVVEDQSFKKAKNLRRWVFFFFDVFSFLVLNFIEDGGCEGLCFCLCGSFVRFGYLLNDYKDESYWVNT